MKKIIFGGAFDPIHQGHINMAFLASKQLDADVIFVPSKVSVWKNTSHSSIDDKLALINIAIKGYQRFSIDTFEINNPPDITYTIETVKYFTSKYPNDKFFYLMGADQVNQFHLWNNAEEIAKLVQLVYFKRPDYEIDKNNVEKFNMFEIKGTMVNTSSTDIRIFDKLDISIEELEYICKHKLFLNQKVASFLDDKRYYHSCEVAKLAYRVAVKNKLDNPSQYYVAGLLHDIGKNNVNKEEIMKEHFPDYAHLPHFSYHQFVGRYIAEKEFGIKDESILRSIEFHATGIDHMDLLGKVVYASDKVEPTRDFETDQYIQALFKNAEKGFLVVLEQNRDYFIKKNIPYDNELTSKCFDFYLK